MRGYARAVWPDPVEPIAVSLRAAGVDARLEELPPGEDSFPGLVVAPSCYGCGPATVVALVPADRSPDPAKVEAAARCTRIVPVPAPPFPYPGARVLVEQLVLQQETIWIEAGTSRHAVAIAPTQLVRLTRAVAVDLLAEV
jgi:hypothetical protein